MIRLYNKSETSFLHNKTVLKDCLSTRIIERANDMYEAEIEYPINEVSKGIKEEMVFTAPTSWGTQEPFRIYKIFKNLFTYTIYGRHITDDLRANYIEDTRPTNTSGQLALNAILAGTQYPHPFTATSNISTLSSATYIRKNPIQAIMGADANSFLNRWGGEVKRSGYNIQIDSAIGVDRGFEIRLGKNLLGIEEDLDISSVITRVHPTYVTDNVVYELPEKYIDSPLISNYAHPRILELRVEIPEEIRELGTVDIENYIRAYVSVFYSSGNDLPNINYKIDFTKLIPGTEYPDEYRYTHGILANMTHAEISALTHEQLNSVIERNVAILDQLKLYDTVTINVSSLDIALKAKVISTTWDALRGRYSEIELGNFKPSLVNQEVNLDKKLQEVISAVNNGEFAEKLKDINDKITSANGGYIVTRYNALGQPYEILAMDTQDLNTAVNVIRINQNGIGFSTSGYNGPFNVAITIDGQILAQYITATSLDAISANLGTITAGRIQDASNESYWDLDANEFNLENGTISGTEIIGGKITSTSDIQGFETLINQGLISQQTPPGSTQYKNSLSSESLAFEFFAYGNRTRRTVYSDDAILFLNNAIGNFYLGGSSNQQYISLGDLDESENATFKFFLGANKSVRLPNKLSIGKTHANGVLDISGDVYINNSNIAEIGSNALGSWTKYYDGTMICRGVFSEIIGCTTAMDYGGGYRSSSVIKDFPQPFTGRPVVTCSLEEYGSNNSISVMVAPLPTDFLNKCFCQWRTISSDVERARSAGYIAVGRWN